AENDALKLDLKELQQKPIQLNQETEIALKEANQKIRELETQNKKLTENATEFNQLNELQKKQLTGYNNLLTKYAKNDKIALENYIESLKNKPLSHLTKEK